MNCLSRIAVLTGFLTCTGLAFVYASPVASAQDDEIPPAPPGYEHTGEKWHTGLAKYKVIVYPDGTEKHTGETWYLWAYKLKKITPVEA